MQERRFIDDFLRGDPSALRVLDGWIEVVLHGSARTCREEWDDLKQEVRARVFRNLSRGSFDGRSALRTYVHRIAKNVCIDFLRKVRSDQGTESNPASHESAERSSDGGFAAWAARDLVVKILDGFSEDDRLLLELVFVEHCSYSEIAERLSIPEGTVKSRMFRCKNRIIEKHRALLERGSAP